MSEHGDHPVEMPSLPLDENAVESFLSGRPARTGELGPLDAFADDIRVAVNRPVPVPTGALATLLTDGIPTPTGAVAAGSAQRTGRGADARKRRKFVTIAELLAALAAKLTGLGMAAKAALGLGVAAASVTGAGAAGILPDPAQNAVAAAVSAVSPFELPDSGSAVTADEGAGGTDGVIGDADGPTAGARADNHGACVSEVAKNAPKGPGGVHGEAVSAAARSDCGKDSSTSTTTPTSTSTTSTTIDGDVATADDNRGRGGPGPNGGGAGNSGPGNSGNGNGNSGNGNSGNSGSSGPGNSGGGGGQGPGRSGGSR